MTINDPIVITGIGAALAIGGWLIRRLDGRIEKLETAVEHLQTQMVIHDGVKEAVDRTYQELRTLSELTHRIAGKLNIS